MARHDDDDYDERVARTAARFKREQEIVDELDARARRAADADAQATAERHAKAALMVARARQAAAAAPRVKTKYEGPDPDRASRGNFVSREELADFQRKYGADKTLRDLLNADRGLTHRGSPPPATEDMRSRGVQGANIAPKPPTLRSLLGTTAPEVKEDALTRIAGRQPTKRPEQERDEARDRAAAALSLMGGLGANVGLRTLAGRMRAGQPAPASRSGSRRSPDEEMQDRIEPPFKKGGKVKTYASGGSVKGSGCERRGLRPCKVY